MSVRSTLARRSGVVAAAVAVALSLSAPPASARSQGFSKSSGQTASASWVEVGELDGVAGNVHTGNLFVDGSSADRPWAYGDVFDWTCPEGVRPPHGGYHWEDPETECTLESVRFLYGGPDEIDFRMDRKLTSAQLTGRLNVSDHDGSTAATPAVNMVWTGIGDAYTSTESGRYSDGGSTYRFRYTFSGRSAGIDGTIGSMGFSDDTDDESWGQMGSYRNMSRWQER